MAKPGVFDCIVLVVLVAWPLVEWLCYWPRCVKAIRAGTPGARARLYGYLVATEWIVTLCVLGLWVAKGRSWSALWLASVGPLRLSLGLLFAGIIISLLWLQTRKILAQPRAIAKVREKLAFADPLIPETSGEHYGFWLVSVTAGICEEILFRGFLIWFFAAWTGLAAGIVLSSIVFGFAHIYLGTAQVPKTALVGFVLALVVVASGSLLPAIVIHAALDLNSGELGFRIGRAAALDSSPASAATN